MFLARGRPNPKLRHCPTGPTDANYWWDVSPSPRIDTPGTWKRSFGGGDCPRLLDWWIFGCSEIGLLCFSEICTKCWGFYVTRDVFTSLLSHICAQSVAHLNGTSPHLFIEKNVNISVLSVVLRNITSILLTYACECKLILLLQNSACTKLIRWVNCDPRIISRLYNLYHNLYFSLLDTLLDKWFYLD